MEIRRSGSQPSGKGPAEYFTGTVRVDPLFQAPESKERSPRSCRMNRITMEGIMNTPLMLSACNLVFWVFVAFASPAAAQTAGQLIPHRVKLESVDYLGKRAIKITEDGSVGNGE